uniref:Uncharacterized protein n=1 Tax=Ascaris lumbricoides TaxID=6252 RepID=A0A0M3I4T2_ASCLU
MRQHHVVLYYITSLPPESLASDGSFFSYSSFLLS